MHLVRIRLQMVRIALHAEKIMDGIPILCTTIPENKEKQEADQELAAGFR